MAELCALIEPHYPKAGNGRQPVGVERMLRIYFLQQWFNLSDPAVEEALYDSVVMRQFVGIDLGRSRCRTRRRCASSAICWKEHRLGGEMLEAVNLHLQRQGGEDHDGHDRGRDDHHAPCSTKNREQERDPEMHQTKKGNQWYFGMKAHVGRGQQDEADSLGRGDGGQRADSTVLPELLHGEETKVWGDQAYRGQTESDAGSGARGAGHDHAGIAIRIASTKRNARRTGRSRECARKLSTCLEC